MGIRSPCLAFLKVRAGVRRPQLPTPPLLKIRAELLPDFPFHAAQCCLRLLGQHVVVFLLRTCALIARCSQKQPEAPPAGALAALVESRSGVQPVVGVGRLIPTPRNGLRERSEADGGAVASASLSVWSLWGP